ncbi:MAG TPA: DUF6084 family protein, partial [Streptosporangiaceae bacterium]|nr:DUF6084 family protein [Streptosporangiaceae bacterium]
HFPNSGWITMSRQTLDELQRFKTRRALPTWDATVSALLAEAADAADLPPAGAADTPPCTAPMCAPPARRTEAGQRAPSGEAPAKEAER